MPTGGDDNVLAMRMVRNKMLAKKLDFLKDSLLAKRSVDTLHNPFETDLEEDTPVDTLEGEPEDDSSEDEEV